jgi:hypothetical protein
MQEDSGIETTQVLIQLLCDTDRRIQDVVERRNMEVAFRLCQREAHLALQAMQLNQREARYDSLLLVRLVRRLRRIFTASR